MTASIKYFEIKTPSGKILRTARKPVIADAERLAAEADAWYERNKRFLEGYSVDAFLDEKRGDVEKGLL